MRRTTDQLFQDAPDSTSAIIGVAVMKAIRQTNGEPYVWRSSLGTTKSGARGSRERYERAVYDVSMLLRTAGTDILGCRPAKVLVVVEAGRQYGMFSDGRVIRQRGAKITTRQSTHK